MNGVPDPLVKIRRVMFVTVHTQNKNRRRERRQLNVLGARLCRNSGHAAQLRKNSVLRGLLFALGVALGRTCQDLLGDQAGVLADRHFDLGGHIGIGFEERLGILAALP
jgi:hypothetical protein